MNGLFSKPPGPLSYVSAGKGKIEAVPENERTPKRLCPDPPPFSLPIHGPDDYVSTPGTNTRWAPNGTVPQSTIHSPP